MESLRGKNPTESHGALSELCGDFIVDRRTFFAGLIVFVVVV